MSFGFMGQEYGFYFKHFLLRRGNPENSRGPQSFVSA
jgi:hypothetical protein